NIHSASEIAKSVVGLELRGGVYVRDDSLNIFEYDGLHIPFPAASFDMVFSSNVMEHISAQKQINGEIRRVLRPGGSVIHVMPTRVWRILTSMMHYPTLLKKALLRNGEQPQVTNAGGTQDSMLKRIENSLIPARHGELGNWFAEYRYFGVSQWRRHFARMGW